MLTIAPHSRQRGTRLPRFRHAKQGELFRVEQRTSGTMPRLYPFSLAAAFIIVSTAMASAQFGGPPIMPSDGFRKTQPPPAAPPPAPSRPMLARPGTTSTSAVL